MLFSEHSFENIYKSIIDINNKDKIEVGSIKTDYDIIEKSVSNCPLLTKQVSIK